MKTCLISLLILLVANTVFAQQISFRQDTILANGIKYGLWRTGDGPARAYMFYSLDGTPLVELHDSHTEVDGKPSNVVTFMNDKKTCLVAEDAEFPKSFIVEMMHAHLVLSGEVNDRTEQLFIKQHPLPDGFHDPYSMFFDTKRTILMREYYVKPGKSFQDNKEKK